MSTSNFLRETCDDEENQKGNTIAEGETPVQRQTDSIVASVMIVEYVRHARCTDRLATETYITSYLMVIS